MEENENVGVPKQAVVSYNGREISVAEPQNADNNYVAYIRPGDTIQLGFDLKSIKVDVVRGDMVVIFPNGSTITMASLAALGFSENAPVVRTKDGDLVSLEELLNKAEVLDYNQAVLILSNRDEVKLTDEKPDIIRTASAIDETLDNGTPISGVGQSDVLTKGTPALIIDPSGYVIADNSEVGKGRFVVSINTSNSPYTKDQDNNAPGSITLELRPNIVSTILYGSEVTNSGNVTMNGVQYNQFVFRNGLGFTNDKSSQLIPNRIDRSGATENVYINNNTASMRYVLNISYERGVFPTRMDIIIPASVTSFVTLSDNGTGGISNITIDPSGNRVYAINSIDPTGRMDFTVSFPQNTPITIFDLSYFVEYLNPSTNAISVMEVSTNLVITPAATQADLDQAPNVLSSTPNGVDAITGSGNDIIIGGGGNNIINSNGGDDFVFSGVTNDDVSLGAGNDRYWGSIGADIIEAAAGYDIIYYDNQVVPIDNTDTNFRNSYYQTFNTNNGHRSFLGVQKSQILNLLPNDSNLAAVIQKATDQAVDGSSFIGKYNGFDLLNNTEEIFMPLGSDTVVVSSFYAQAMLIHGGLGQFERAVFDTLVIDNTFNQGNGAIVDFSLNYKDGVNGAKGGGIIGEVKLTDNTTIKFNFDGFERYRGSSGNDTFYSTGVKDADQLETIAFWIDGGAGSGDIISYIKGVNMTSIIFDATQGRLEKVTTTPGALQEWDMLTNFEIFEGTTADDRILGAAFNYTYRSGGGTNNVLSYERSAAVTFVFEESRIYKKYTSDVNNLGTNFDFVEDINNFRVSLSNSDDVIIARADGTGSYNVNGGGGFFDRDLITYQYLTNDLTVNVNVGVLNMDHVGGIDVSSNAYDIYEIIGSRGVTRFFGDTGSIGRGNKFTGIVNGNTSLSYAGGTGVGAVTGGVTFKLGGVENIVEKVGGGTDFFSRITNLVGSVHDDIVFFTDTINNISEIQGFSIDLGPNSSAATTTDLVNLSQLKGTILGGGVTNASVHVRGITNGIEIEFGYYNTSGAWVSDPANIAQFLNVDGITGTANNDQITVGAADATTVFVFDGYIGTDIADYTGVTIDVIFDISSQESGNVYKGGVLTQTTNGRVTITGGTRDTILNTEVIRGSSANRNIFLGSELGSYNFFGGNLTTDVLDYSKSSTGVTVDFSNSRVNKSLGGVDNFDVAVDSIRGSNYNDNFLGYINTGALISRVADGGLLTVVDLDVMNFSQLTTGITINLTKGSDTTLSAGNIDWTLRSIEGLILTNQDDTITLVGRNIYSIDGRGGIDLVDYSTDTANGLNSLVINISASLSTTKYFTEGAGLVSFIDTLINVERLTLSTNNDRVFIATGHGTNSITEINAGAGIDDLILSQLASNITVTVSDAGFNLAGLEGNKVINFINFEAVTGTARDTTFVINNSLTATNLQLSGSGITGSTTTVDFSGVAGTGGITLTLRANETTDSVAGAITITAIRFLSIDRFVLTAGDDTVIASASKNSLFVGGAGTDTLNYNSFAAELGGVRINITEGRVYKFASTNSFDQYQTVERISATNNDDTVEIVDTTALTVDINMLLGNDNIFINTTVAATYDMVNNRVVISGTNLDLSRVTGAEVLSLSNNDDTLVYRAGGPVAAAGISTFRGGNNAAVTGTVLGDSIDASALTVGFAFFAIGNPATGASRIYTGALNPTDTAATLLTNAEASNYFEFETVRGSSTLENRFYSDIVVNYNYIGGASTQDMISYETAVIGVEFDLGLSRVIKAGGLYNDTYSNIEVLTGSNNNDIFKLKDAVYDRTAAEVNALNLRGLAGEDVIIFDLATKGNVVFTMVNNTSYTTLVGTTTYTTNFGSITGFQATRNVNTFNIGDISRSLKFTGSAAVSGVFRDTLNYTAGNVTFSTVTSTVTRTQGTNPDIIDFFNSYGVLSYSGTGNAVFVGSLGQAYTFSATNTTNATLDYSSLVSDAITVDFTAAGAGTVALAGKVDNFSGMTRITGGFADDTFILAANPTTSVVVDGGGGINNSISADKMFTGANPIIRASTFNFIGGGSGYTLVNIQTFGLTTRNDTFIMDIPEPARRLSIDGLAGVNTIDYTELPASYTSSTGAIITGVFNISFNFINGAVTRTITDTATNNIFSYNESLLNFQGARTGAGNDEFIVGNAQVSTATIDAGGGNNSLDFSAVTYTMNVKYGTVVASPRDFTASYSGTGAPTGTQSYRSFSTVKLGTGVNNILDYTYQANHITGSKLLFAGGIQNTDTSRSTLNIDSSIAQVFYMDLRNTGGYISTTVNPSNVNYFMEIQYFKTIRANGSASFNIISNGLSNYIFAGNATLADTLSYENTTASGVRVEVTDGATKAMRITNNSNSVGEEATNFDNIRVKADSTVVLSQHSGSRILNISMQSGGTVSFENYTSALTGLPTTVLGYNITGADKYTLTRFGDSITSIENQNFDIAGGGVGAGQVDTMRYDVGFTRPIEIRDLGDNQFDIRKNNTTNTDLIRDFTNLVLNASTPDVYKYVGQDTGTKRGVIIDFGGAEDTVASNRRDTIDYSEADFGATFNISGVIASRPYTMMDVATLAGATYSMRNVEILVGAQGDDTFIIASTAGADNSSLAQLRIDGGLGVNTLNTSSIGTTYTFKYDLINGVVELIGRPLTSLKIDISNITHIIGNHGNSSGGPSTAVYFLGVNNIRGIKEPYIIEMNRGGGTAANLADDLLVYNGNDVNVPYQYSSNAIRYTIGALEGTVRITTAFKAGYDTVATDDDRIDKLFNVAHLVGTNNADTVSVLNDINTNTPDDIVRVYAGDNNSGNTVNFANYTQAAATAVNFRVEGTAASGAYAQRGAGTNIIGAYNGFLGNLLVNVAGQNKYRFYVFSDLVLGNQANTVSYNLGVSVNYVANNVTATAGTNDSMSFNLQTISGVSTAQTVLLDLVSRRWTSTVNSINYQSAFNGIENFSVNNLNADGTTLNTVALNATIIINESSTFQQINLAARTNAGLTSHTLDTTFYNSNVAVSIEIVGYVNNRINLVFRTGALNNSSVSGVERLLLGNNDNTLIVSAIPTASTGISEAINAGSERTADTLELRNSASNYNIVLNSGNIIVRNDTGTINLLNFVGFEKINFSNLTGAVVVDIYSEYAQNISEITGNNNVGTALVFSNGIGGNFEGIITLNILGGGSGNVIFNTVKTIDISGIRKYVLGDGNDTVRVSAAPTAGDLLDIDSKRGVDAITMDTDANFNMVYTFVGDVATGRLAGADRMRLTGFSNFTMGGFANPIGEFIFSSGTGSNINFYTINSVNTIRINYDNNFQDLNIDNGNVQLSSATKGYVINNARTISLTNQANKAYILNLSGTFPTQNRFFELVETGALSSYATNNVVNASAMTIARKFDVVYKDGSAANGYAVNIGANSNNLPGLGSTYDYRVVGFSTFVGTAQGDLISYKTTLANDANVPANLVQNFVFDGSSGNDTVYIAGTGYTATTGSVGTDMRGRITRGGGMVDSFSNVETLDSSTAPASLNIGSDVYLGRAANNNQGFQHAKMSDENDVINVRGMEANKVIDTGISADSIYLTGDALLFKIEEKYDQEVYVGDKKYYTGGVYLTMTDQKGNVMYFLNSTLDELIYGGVKEAKAFNFDAQYQEDANLEYSYDNAYSFKASKESAKENSVEPVKKDATNSLEKANMAKKAFSQDELSTTNEHLAESELEVFLEDVTATKNANEDNNTSNKARSGLEDFMLENVSKEDTLDVFDSLRELINEGNQTENNADAVDVSVSNVAFVEISKEEIESTYKMDSENNTDPLKLLYENLNKS